MTELRNYFMSVEELPHLFYLQVAICEQKEPIFESNMRYIIKEQ